MIRWKKEIFPSNHPKTFISNLLGIVGGSVSGVIVTFQRDIFFLGEVLSWIVVAEHRLFRFLFIQENDTDEDENFKTDTQEWPQCSKPVLYTNENLCFGSLRFISAIYFSGITVSTFVVASLLIIQFQKFQSWALVIFFFDLISISFFQLVVIAFLFLLVAPREVSFGELVRQLAGQLPSFVAVVERQGLVALFQTSSDSVIGGRSLNFSVGIT